MSWDRAFADRAQALAREPAARGPASLSEVWKSEWNVASLDTTFGSSSVMPDAFEELRKRTAEITGREIPDLARERGLDFHGRSFDGKIDTMQKIVDSLPDHQAKLLTDYKDVRGRARAKASDMQREADDVRSASYGLSPMAVGFAAQTARQMVDPVNLALAPIGGPAKGPVFKWLGKEFAIGVGGQAVQEPAIRFRREELGLENNSLENILTAGIGQAGFAGLFKLAGVAGRSALDAARGGEQWRVGQGLDDLAQTGNPDDAVRAFAESRRRSDQVTGKLEDIPTPDEQAQMRLEAAAPQFEPRNRMPQLSEVETAELQGLSTLDFAALARQAEADQTFDALAGTAPNQIVRFQDASRFLNEGGLAPARAPGLSMDGIQNISRGDGLPLQVRYALVERGDIQTSHSADGLANPNYPQALQPRDRSRNLSTDWINTTASRLNPDLLHWSASADQGAPILGPDGLVESGNGRVLAIETAYSQHPDQAKKYRDRIEEMGFDTQGMKQPVLVRIRMNDISDADRVKLTIESNKPTMAGLSATERAFADARMMDDNAMQLWQGGDVTDARNAQFVRSFVDRALSTTERNNAIDSAGRLSQEGARRLEAALVAKAWNYKPIVQALTEATDDEAKAILGAMADTAPVVAQLKAAVADGRIDATVDPSTAVIRAYEMVAKARKESRPVAELLDQMDLERGAVPADVQAAVRLFYADDAMTQAASRKKVAARLDHAISRALMHQGGGFFADVADAGQFLRAARFADDNLSNVDMAKAMAGAADEKPVKKVEVQPGIGNRQMENRKLILEKTTLENAFGEDKTAFMLLGKPQFPYPNDIIFNIRSGDVIVGHAMVSKPYPDGVVSVRAIRNLDETPMQLGTAAVRSLVAELSREFPDIKGIAGVRLSGAREVAGVADEARRTIMWLDPEAKRANAEAERAWMQQEAAANQSATASKPDRATLRMQAVLDQSPDMVVHVERADGSQKAVPMREHMEQLRAERNAATELQDCIIKAGGSIT